MRRHRDRLDHDHRAGHQLHADRGRRVAGHAPARAAADRDRRPRPRHGHADHAGLHRDGLAARAALIKLGAMLPAAHMFAFYFAILSAITPPVALAVFAAAGSRQSRHVGRRWAAMRVGAAGFIVPFMFVFEPALLMIGPWHVTRCSRLRPPSSALIALAASLYGYLLQRSRYGSACCCSSPRLLPDRAGPGYRARSARVFSSRWPGRRSCCAILRARQKPTRRNKSSCRDLLSGATS